MLTLIALISTGLFIASPIAFGYLLYQKIFGTSTIIFWFASIDSTGVFSTPLYMIIIAIVINFIGSTLNKIFGNF